MLRSDNRGITPKWDNIFGNSATADSTANNKACSIHISITVHHAPTVELCLMDNPKKWLSTVLQTLRLQSPKYLHTFAYNQNVYSIKWTAPSVPTVLELYKVHSMFR